MRAAVHHSIRWECGNDAKPVAVFHPASTPDACSRQQRERVVSLAQPPVIPNGPVTMVEGETVVQPAQGIEGPGNTSHWCAYNVPGQAAVVYGYLADNSNHSKI